MDSVNKKTYFVDCRCLFTAPTSWLFSELVSSKQRLYCCSVLFSLKSLKDYRNSLKCKVNFHKHIYIYIYIYIYTRWLREVSKLFSYGHLKLSLTLENSVCYYYTSYEMTEQFFFLKQQLEYTLLKPGCHSCWISKMQSDSLEERHAIKFCFKLQKMPQKRRVCFSTILHESCMSFWVA